jgi:hypothetical protein
MYARKKEKKNLSMSCNKRLMMWKRERNDKSRYYSKGFQTFVFLSLKNNNNNSFSAIE